MGGNDNLSSIQEIYSKQKGKATLWRPVLYLDTHLNSIHANHTLTMPGSRVTLLEREHPWPGGKKGSFTFPKGVKVSPLLETFLNVGLFSAHNLGDSCCVE